MRRRGLRRPGAGPDRGAGGGLLREGRRRRVPRHAPRSTPLAPGTSPGWTMLGPMGVLASLLLVHRAGAGHRIPRRWMPRSRPGWARPERGELPALRELLPFPLDRHRPSRWSRLVAAGARAWGLCAPRGARQTSATWGCGYAHPRRACSTRRPRSRDAGGLFAWVLRPADTTRAGRAALPANGAPFHSDVPDRCSTRVLSFRWGSSASPSVPGVPARQALRSRCTSSTSSWPRLLLFLL